MQQLQIILGTLLALVLAYFWLRKFRAKQARIAAQGKDFLFRDLSAVLSNPEMTRGEAAGSWKLLGTYKSQIFQIQTVVDTLATRKLPILWVMVTLPKVQETPTYDFMMRAAGPSTFSNFDFLPHTLPLPAGLPEQAVLRSDDTTPPPADVVAFARLALQDLSVKEVLITPKGRRIVFVSAQAHHARYGVFREANFGEHVIDASLVEKHMKALL